MKEHSAAATFLVTWAHTLWGPVCVAASKGSCYLKRTFMHIIPPPRSDLHNKRRIQSAGNFFLTAQRRRRGRLTHFRPVVFASISTSQTPFGIRTGCVVDLLCSVTGTYTSLHTPPAVWYK